MYIFSIRKEGGGMFLSRHYYSAERKNIVEE